VRLVGPNEGAALAAGASLSVRWLPAAGRSPDFYRVDFETDDGSPLSSALLPAVARRYDAPPWLAARAGRHAIRWRVTALSADGSRVSISVWRTLTAAATLSSPSSSPRP
jgi:hypothetical protein